jgi:hypothetical protein
MPSVAIAQAALRHHPPSGAMASLACGPLTRAAAMADFIGAVALVPHNAAFDLTFLNVELE